MWTYEHSIDTTADPEAVWSLYRDVATWPEWNAAVAAVVLDGEFAAGSTGTLTPRGQRGLPFRLVTTVDGGGYTSETDIAETVTLRLTNTLKPLDGGGTRVTHRAELVGPAAEFFGQSFGPVIANGIPPAMHALVDRAARSPAADR